ncbi:apolipoprotein N-acyltransferase [Sanguibacter sp. A247]|uniref:apolipoprotein N-acyltransferase n=1 Tax=unclassified Sanguibacter TaxID=2645534 RepID=UPI003FD7E578
MTAHQGVRTAQTSRASRTARTPRPAPTEAARPRRVSLVLALAVAAGGGWVTNLGFPDTDTWWLAIAGVAMLVVGLGATGLGGRAAWRAAGLGLAWGLAFFLPHLVWADVSVGAVPWLALSGAQAGMVALACAVYTWVRRASWLQTRPWLEPVAFAVVWTAVELVRSHYPFGGFPWGRLAFSQADSPLGRLAWLGGVPLVSAATALVAGLVAYVLLSLVRLRLLGAAAAVIVAAAVTASGMFVPIAARAEAGTLRVGAVQGNVSEPGSGSFGHQLEVTGNHVAGTLAVLERADERGVDLVVWPENASDVDPRVNPEGRELIVEAVEAAGVPLLFGTQEYVDTGRYNQSVLWVPGEGITHVYAKQVPAAFAEYIPWRSFFERLSDKVALVRTDMLPGGEVSAIPVPITRLDRDVTVASIICFEVAYDFVARDAVKGGAEVLFVPTNNSNFGYTAESTQQLAMTRLRAIETGRAAVQISTVGVSGVVDPAGRVLERTGLFTAEQLLTDLPLRTSTTPAVSLGAGVEIFFAAFASVLLGLGIVSRARSRSLRK